MRFPVYRDEFALFRGLRLRLALERSLHRARFALPAQLLVDGFLDDARVDQRGSVSGLGALAFLPALPRCRAATVLRRRCRGRLAWSPSTAGPGVCSRRSSRPRPTARRPGSATSASTAERRRRRHRWWSRSSPLGSVQAVLRAPQHKSARKPPLNGTSRGKAWHALADFLPRAGGRSARASQPGPARRHNPGGPAARKPQSTDRGDVTTAADADHVLCDPGAWPPRRAARPASLEPLHPVVYAFERSPKLHRKLRSAIGLARAVRAQRPRLVVMEGTGTAGGLTLLALNALWRDSSSSSVAATPSVRIWVFARACSACSAACTSACFAGAALDTSAGHRTSSDERSASARLVR